MKKQSILLTLALVVSGASVFAGELVCTGDVCTVAPKAPTEVELPAAPVAPVTEAVEVETEAAPTTEQPEMTEEEFKKLIEQLMEEAKKEQEAQTSAPAEVTTETAPAA